MEYRARGGIEYGLSDLSQEESQLVEWLRREYLQTRSWIEFHNRTSHGIIMYSKRTNAGGWQSGRLYKIQLDLTANKGVETGAFRGELSSMFSE